MQYSCYNIKNVGNHVEDPLKFAILVDLLCCGVTKDTKLFIHLRQVLVMHVVSQL